MARTSKHPMSRRVSDTFRTVLFPVDLLDDLAPHARRRGVTSNELARRIVDTALDERLIDALLDDQAEAA